MLFPIVYTHMHNSVIAKKIQLKLLKSSVPEITIFKCPDKMSEQIQECTWNNWCLYEHLWWAQVGWFYDVKFHTCDEICKDENQHDAVDKSTTKQQVSVSDVNCIYCINNLIYTPSDSGSCSAGRSSIKKLILNFKWHNSTSNTFLDV